MPHADKVRKAQYSADWYRRNKVRHSANVRKNNKVYFQRNRGFVDQYLRTHPCVDCGFSDIRALDFDHVRGIKVADVSILVTRVYGSLEVIREEIEKCEVRCANCHRIATYDRRVQSARVAQLDEHGVSTSV